MIARVPRRYFEATITKAVSPVASEVAITGIPHFPRMFSTIRR